MTALQAVSDSIRGMIAAPPGKEIIAADFTAIESRVLAWLAGQEDKLDLFRNDGDVYCAQASQIYARKIVPGDPQPPERLAGKVSELSCGFQGGARAAAKMAANYGLKLEPALPAVTASATKYNLEKAHESWDSRGKSSGMTEEAWLAAELIKLAWRDANPKIVQFWYDLENAALDAVAAPGQVIPCGPVAYVKKGSFLFCRLPSGRVLTYPYARIESVKTPWGRKEAVVYKTVDGYTRNWCDKAFYGGLGAENVTQATARDVMAEAMLRASAAGYPLIITIHDELVGEVDIGFGSLEEFLELLCELPSWAKGLPIAADGWRGPRYRK